MPQTYSEFQLQRNRAAGKLFQAIATRAILIGVDIFQFVLWFLRTLFSSLFGK